MPSSKLIECVCETNYIRMRCHGEPLCSPQTNPGLSADIEGDSSIEECFAELSKVEVLPFSV